MHTNYISTANSDLMCAYAQYYIVALIKCMYEFQAKPNTLLLKNPLFTVFTLIMDNNATLET